MKRLLTLAATAALAAAPAYAQNAGQTRTEIQTPAAGQVRTQVREPGQIGGRTAVGTTTGRAGAGRMTAVNDALFAAAAADSGLSEVTLSQLGAQRATDPELKQFSEKMIQEHTRMNAELTQLAARQGMRIPEAVDVRAAFCTQSLAGLSGEQFDKCYAKAQLVAHTGPVNLVLFDTSEFLFQGNPGFTVWPAVSPSQDYETRFGGVEYLMSSTAVFSPSGNGNQIRVFALMNTSAIDANPSQVSLVQTAVHVSLYGVPPPTAQKPGPAPLGECLNDRSINLGGGFIGCWQLFVNPPAPTETVPELVDTNDSRMQQVFFTGGRLYGALDTPVNMPGGRQAGIAYYVIRPYPQAGSVAAVLENEGKFGVAGNSVTYPALAALPDGHGVIAFTLIGPDYYPSAAYIRFNNAGVNGSVRVAAAGKGPEDGFSGYLSLTDPPSNVARWGDYGAAALSGGTFWIASEYIGQVCTLQQYLGSGFTCGGTRAALGNWYTRITQVTP